MILITGATGKLGGKVIETLLKNNVPAGKIAVLARDKNKTLNLKEKGIDIRIGDYDNITALDKAMEGIQKVLLVSALDEGKILNQHRNVIDAAKRAGVSSIAYTSHSLKDRNTLVNPLMETHFETEDDIMASGMQYTIFRNILYMDSMAMFMLGKNVLETGILLPAGEGSVSYALRSDQAEAIGNVLSRNENTSRIYNFTGSRTYSFNDVARALSELTGKQINYTPVSAETFQAQKLAEGVPEHAVEMITSFMTDIKNGQGSTVSKDMEEALGRAPIDLKSGLKLLLNL